MSLLNRRKYKEMMLASLEKKQLRMSPLDMRFHLRDLIGSGHLETDLTPTGLIVRISKDQGSKMSKMYLDPLNDLAAPTISIKLNNRFNCSCLGYN